MDKIDLTGVTTVHAFADLAMTDTANGALIDFGSGDTILLKNVLVANLSAADFLFA